MLRHLFKLIWNKKGAHSLLIIEIWASFMVLFGVLSLIAYNLNNYLEPIGFEYKDVWVLDLSTNQDTVNLPEKSQRIMQRIISYPEVLSATRTSGNTPFSANQMSNSSSYNKVSVSHDFYVTDEDFSKTLDLPLRKGRWYEESDISAKFIPIVINKKMEDKLFANENPLGKLIKENDTLSYKIVGVVDKYKAKGEFMADNPALFKMIKKEDWDRNVLIKVKPGTDANFEARLVKDIAAMTDQWGIEVSYLTESRKNRQNLTVIPVVIFLVICGFLLTNVALGLFGILNLNIAKRKNEIGLRRAMGATEGNVTKQFLGEIWVLATFSLIIGLVFAIQFPLMHVFDLNSEIYITAILVSIAVIYIIVTLCAWLPSRQASLIHPALALHED
ncbi:ABC transporter permease [Dyadobacter sediminis]|uniref:FtsX-like permease family protein n=1 Tax=Dyadobacter sediminis TaxID=1493691 RepID=A0A5R9KKF7_9BACT|nr:FtsX-like permease family protein [Dyadobacter sediminis]TLU96536.1 FtsX-like permease family protein [Dyadobacter sediminis]GGB83014.1 ABC transporter permease [Dyadobacter sediminis]